jgi:hypothetical protein
MNNVISFAEARARRLKEALAIYSRNGEPAIVETRTGWISAEKITCRGRFAEILNAYGDYFVIDYADIRSVRPGAVAQHSVVNARGDFTPIPDIETVPAQVAILPFPSRMHRG